MNRDLKNVRKSYEKDRLNADMIPPSPAELLTAWMDEAREVDPDEFNAMVLSTVDEHGHPDARVVLAKDIKPSSLTFYTNYESAKGKQLMQHPVAALTFYWPGLERQVRIKGHVTRVDSEESNGYFASRPRASQLGAWASNQSRPLAEGETMEERLREIEARFEGDANIPRPLHWGGFEVEFEVVEFWQGRPSRLHDRWRYHRIEQRWNVEGLQP